MAIIINKKLFTVEEVINKLNHTKTLEMVYNLESVQAELVEQKETLSNMVTNHTKTIEDIQTQLNYLKLNINTFKDALVYFEKKSFEYLITSNGISLKISKN